VRGLSAHRESTIDRARRLRRDQTRAEVILWNCLRNRGLDGFKFRRQVPIDRYFADFACREAKVVVELDGGQHADAIAYDEARTEVIEQAGYRVVRLWNNHVVEELDGALEEISRALKSART
jgi:very-short-patch-repair endonuclease